MELRCSPELDARQEVEVRVAAEQLAAFMGLEVMLAAQRSAGRCLDAIAGADVSDDALLLEAAAGERLALEARAAEVEAALQQLRELMGGLPSARIPAYREDGLQQLMAAVGEDKGALMERLVRGVTEEGDAEAVAALTSLDLRSKRLGPEAALALAWALHRCTALHTLRLASNQLGMEGVSALAAVLPHCAALQTLTLGHNGLGDDGVGLLAQVLPSCLSLQSLGLNGCNISGRGAQALVSVLPQCTTLQTLGLSHNSIDAAGKAALQQVKARCVALNSIHT